MLRHHLIVSACAVASFAVVTPSMASLVSVTGGFTSFESTVIDRTSVPSMLNGAPICATAGCSTTGDAFVNFSTPISKLSFDVGDVPNSVRFEAAAPQEVTGTGPASPFLLGRFFYENGIWSGDATFGFTLTTKSSDPLLDGKTLTDYLHLALTPNDFVNGTPQDNADFIYFQNTPLILDVPPTPDNPLGSVRAFELQDSPTGSNIFSADVFGYIGSLHLAAFANGSGGGFLDAGVDFKPTPTSVPEPGTVSLFGSAALALGFIFRRRTPRSRRVNDIDPVSTDYLASAR